jgi:hypothetical protein
LLLMRFPVRCLNCHERSFTSLMQFQKLRSMRTASSRFKAM